MMHNCFEAYEKLLKDMKKLPSSAPQEVNLLSVGGKGHYENPTTDLFAFFCDDKAAHNLGALVLNALIECLPTDFHNLDRSLINEPMREVSTSRGRIDLVLVSDQWVIVLENKIFHHQKNNPFDDYEAWSKEGYSNKKHIFIVLTPYEKSHLKNWHVITYKSFIAKIKEKLSEHIIEYPLSKWTVLLREFLLHLEGVMFTKSSDDQSMDFIFNNFSRIIELENLKKKVVNDYHQDIQRALCSKLQQNVEIRLHHWWGRPAMRFYFKNWKTDSDVVLHKKEDSGFLVNFYFNMKESSEDIVDNFVDLNACEILGNEKNNTYRCYQVTNLGTQTFDEIVTEIGKRLLEIDKYEQSI